MAGDSSATARLEKTKRHYNSWVVNETLEDYSLRYAPRSFRKWSEFTVANAALGEFLTWQILRSAVQLQLALVLPIPFGQF